MSLSTCIYPIGELMAVQLSLCGRALDEAAGENHGHGQPTSNSRYPSLGNWIDRSDSYALAGMVDAHLPE